MSKKILVATEKPFAKTAVEHISQHCQNAGYELVLLESYKEPQTLIDGVADADALIVRSDKVTPEVLNAGKKLKIVVRAGAGFDNIHLATATEKGIVVMNTPGQNSNAVAELVFGLMLNLARRQYTGKSGTELRGKKIGLQAYGNVGRAMNRIAKGFGMETYAYDPFIPKETIEADGVQVLDSAESLYSTCDYISIHLPKMKETIGLVNYNLLSKLKKGATVINSAREDVINEADLLKILEERTDLFFGADVAPKIREQITEKFGDRTFFTAKKMGAQTSEANVNAGIAAITQIINFFEKGDTTFQVNK